MSDQERIKELERELVKLKTISVLKRGVRLVRDYDLRTSQPLKHEDTINSKDWTAFINKKTTLVHVMRRGCPHMLIRIPLYSAKYRSLTKYIKAALYEDMF